MLSRMGSRLLLTAAIMAWGCVALAADAPDKAAVDKAFDALTAFDFGDDVNALKAIDDAIVAAHGNAAASKDLEMRLAAVLTSGAKRGAKDFACRKLKTVGTAQSVPTLAALLADKELSHMARYALERNTAPEAAVALREGLGKTSGAQKAGVIGSLGARRDAASVAAIAALAGDSDKAIANAAVAALGLIGNAEAAKALDGLAQKAPAELKAAVADARLSCAETLLADGNKVAALVIYKSLAGEDQPKEVRLAATRGILAAAGKKE